VWKAEGPLAYDNVVLSSKMPAPCSITGPTGGGVGGWSVDLQLTAAGTLRVTWSPTLSNTFTFICPKHAPIDGEPGLGIFGIGPLQFELPAEGGARALAGGMMTAAGGWDSTGTLTVRRLPGP
jgi:hypothetical protein